MRGGGFTWTAFAQSCPVSAGAHVVSAGGESRDGVNDWSAFGSREGLQATTSQAIIKAMRRSVRLRLIAPPPDERHN
ncbi:MAG: hypothetical protein M3R38_36805, partial [Actinomycetota bacterium]|nr:hypothetical protein [Actinomycetota bacterium]